MANTARFPSDKEGRRRLFVLSYILNPKVIGLAEIGAIKLSTMIKSQKKPNFNFNLAQERILKKLFLGDPHF